MPKEALRSIAPKSHESVVMTRGLTRRLEYWVTTEFGLEAPWALRQMQAHEPVATSQEPERILAGIAFVGRRRSLPEALELARIDWRDLLVAAGLADEDWPEVLRATLGPLEEG